MISSKPSSVVTSYEDYLAASLPSINDSDLASVLLFPNDDIRLIEVEKKFSTLEQLRPELEAELDQNISDCLRSYNTNYSSLVKNYAKFTTCHLSDQKRHVLVKTAKTCDLQEFESELPIQEHEKLEFDENYHQDTDNHNIIDTVNRENDQIRSKPRPLSLFSFYPCQPRLENLSVDSRLNPNPPTIHICNRILVKCLQLKFELDIEPLWATMCLYDLKSKRKISENFAFDLNTDVIKQMLHTHQTHQDQSTLAKSCIFNITYPSPDLFVVIRIEKVLQQGDISECVEPYMKSQSQSGLEKLQANAVQFCERLGKYRMPFVWTAVNVMSLLNNSTNSKLETTGNATNPSADINLQQKSASLDRRFPKYLDGKECDTGDANESGEDLIESVGDFKFNGSHGFKNAQETFRKPGGASELNKRNSLVNCSSIAAPSVANTATPTFVKTGSLNGSTPNSSQIINNPQHDEHQNSLSNRLNRFKPIAITVNTFFKQESDRLSDEDLFRCLNDLKKQTNLVKKLKCVPGFLKMEFSPFNHDLTSDTLQHQTSASLANNYILTPELQLLKFNLSHQNTTNTSPATINSHYHQPLLIHNHLLPIKDLLEFPSWPVYEPNSLYRNILYVYPGTVNFCGASNLIRSGASSTLNSGSNLNQSSLTSSIASSSARNIAIKINLMKGEEEHCALPVLFAKSSSTSEYCKEAFVSVVYHNKTPQYHDEIKIKLPALLSGATYHLLFTFYHVSCQNSKDQNQLESIIGYSWLPIQQQFQYETSIRLTNDSSNPVQSTNTPGSVNTSTSDTVTVTPTSTNPSISSTELASTLAYTQTNRCSIIKNGTYSLPISFEKLISGYSALNYSVFNTSTSSTDITNINEIDLETKNPDFDSDSVNIQTTINNINCSNLTPSSLLTSSSAKSYFDVGLKLVSTIHTQDVYINRFISLANQLRSSSRLNRTEATSESAFTRSLSDICFADSEELIKFLYVIFDKLLFFIFHPSSAVRLKCLETLNRLVLRITNILPNQNDPHKRNRLLVQYVSYACKLPPSTNQLLFHEQLLTEWLTLVQSSKQQNRQLRKLLSVTSWFCFELIFKSMASYLDSNSHCLSNKSTNQFNKLPYRQISLNTFCTKSLSQKFISDLENLISTSAKEIIKLNEIGFNVATLNCSLAFLLRDLLSLIDRGLVFRRIEFYFKETNKELANISNQILQIRTGYANSGINTESLMINFRELHMLQLDFLRIICSHEHFTALNLPIFFDQAKSVSSNGGSASQKKFIIESNEYFTKHFLIGLVLRQSFKSLHSSFTSVQYKCVQLLRNIFEANDIDPRLANNKKARAHIAYMYMPFLNLFIHYIPLVSMKPREEEQTNDLDELTEEMADSLLIDNDTANSSFLTGSETDFIETSLNLDEFDVDLDRNSDYNFTMDDILNEDLMTDLLHEKQKINNININNSFNSGASNTNNGLKNFRKISQQITRTDVKKSKLSVSSAASSLSQSSIAATSAQRQRKARIILNKTKPCCDFYNLRMNLMINQDSTGLDCTPMLSVESSQDLLICFLWILKNMDKELLFKVWKQWSHVKLKKLLVLFDLCVSNFEFKNTVWSEFVTNHLANEDLFNKNNNNNNNNNNKTKNINLNTSSSGQKGVLSMNTSISSKSQKTSRQYFSASAQSITPTKTYTAKSKLDYSTNFFRRVRYLKYTDPKCAVDLLTYDLGDCVSGLNKLSHMGKEDSISYGDRLALEGNLSTECLLIISDSIELIIEIIQCHEHQYQLNSQSSSYNQHLNQKITINNTAKPLTDIFQVQNLLKNLTKLLHNALSCQQSTRALANLFNIQRDLVRKFSDLLFDLDTACCSEICTILLRHCTSKLCQIRAQSSASLYFLMRQNYEIGNGFSRVKIQLTLSLSSLLTGINTNDQRLIILSDFLNITSLKKSLKLILTYADNDLELIETTFPCQVKDLIINLNTIVTDTVKMSEFLDDPDMLVDLMHRIANCYQSSPDMRLVWLQNMAQKHLEKQNLIEAGQCLIHAAALVAEYLAMLENRSYLPVGCASFKNVSINVLEESAISDDVLQSVQGVCCTGKYFSETGLIGLVEQAAVFLMHSQNYEVANQLYKILIPIYEHHRDIKKLSQVHSKLHDGFNKILLNGARRLFGTYFRVGFYGYRFEDINGEEFIYKEPGITKLSEIAHRLENFYTEKFGEGCVEIMKDSNNVDKKSLDLVSKAYIQITYVEPYFDRWETQKCTTFFEKNYSLKRFIYSTPFTLEGRAHGALNEQYKRKTILTIERAFPYVKLRIPVIDKQQIILNPVEVAVEDLQKKIEELKSAIAQEPSDPKILQMVLQGCVGTTVNQGPLEMALTFLQPTSASQITEHHNKLRLCFKNFSMRCSEALIKNKLLIGSDQLEYQREMERNYTELKSKIEPLIENSFFKE